MKKYKHDYETRSMKLCRKLHTLFYRMVRDRKKASFLYASYRHRKIKPATKEDVKQYMTQSPNYSAGFGHGLDIWRNGIINANHFGLEYAYMPMVSETWEEALGFGEREKSIGMLLQEGYREILLPYYDLSDEKSIKIIKQIITSYRGEKIIFKNEFEQSSDLEKFMISADYMRRKFWESSARKKDNIMYSGDEISVAVHIRRGDVNQEQGKKNANIRKRWLDEEYYVNIINEILQMDTKKKLKFYIFSEGKKEDFVLLNNLKDIDMQFCLDMPATDSFIHMCRADLLIVGLSSFSYDPGLINPALKIASDKFWNPYPENGEWIIAEENGQLTGDGKKSLNGYLSMI